MASYHLTAKIGAKGKAAAHAAYISREGKYSGRERYEDLEATSAGNMPKWAEHEPAHFWNAADEHERANGSAYREIEVALPRELTPNQRRELVEDFVRRELGEQHVYQWGIHNPKAALEKGEQPHAHIMYSERRLDGIERDPDQFFKRYNAKNPERGGAQKASGGKARGAMKDELLATRQRWAEVQNEHLARHGHEVRVDHRSLRDQGIDRTPEKHLGGAGVRALAQLDIAALLEHRAAEGERERAQQQVSSLIDLSGDLAAAKSDRARTQAAEAHKRAVEASAAMAVSRYARALENVASETLATVPGLLPPQAIRQALHQVGKEVEAENSDARSVDVDAIRRQVLAQPGMQHRLAQASMKEDQGQVTLENVASMGGIKRMLYDTKAMTQEAHELLAAAKLERAQVNNAVELSPEVQAGLKANEQAKQTRRQAATIIQELSEILPRADAGQALYQRPEHVYRVSETVTRVVEKARAIAPNSLQGMQLAEVERMTAKAVDVEWKKPDSQREYDVRVSRFVLPAQERRQHQERQQARQKQGQDYGNSL
jgi:hypothetical protein